METIDGEKVFNPTGVNDWRKWLEKNGETEKSVWLIIAHKNSTHKGIYMAEAMANALCFGWIDSKAKKYDSESSALRFSPRKAKSNWSKINIERANEMIEKGLMKPQGLKMIEIAKEMGTWNP
jgi:uncharacterized protein YdeI (YjbR/CyaY-like superfamily)